MTDRINYINLIDFNLHVVPTALAFSMLGLYFLIRNNKLLNKTNFQLNSLNKTWIPILEFQFGNLLRAHYYVQGDLNPYIDKRRGFGANWNNGSVSSETWNTPNLLSIEDVSNSKLSIKPFVFSSIFLKFFLIY